MAQDVLAPYVHIFKYIQWRISDDLEKARFVNHALILSAPITTSNIWTGLSQSLPIESVCINAVNLPAGTNIIDILKTIHDPTDFRYFNGLKWDGNEYRILFK